MKITFVLPGYFRHPSGGTKIVYEYASRLQARGHRVTVVHPYYWHPQPRLGGRVWSRRWMVLMRAADRPLAGWFPHHPDVRLRLAPDLRERWLPDADAVFATGWQTAGPVAAYGTRKGRKLYLIQHYETWSAPKAEIDATWRLPMEKIVIARWLRDVADGLGEGRRTTYIPNGIDFDRFRLLTPIAARNPLRVAMLHHFIEWKGAADGVAALTRVRETHPGLEAVFFGTPPRSEAVPAWADYVQNPPQDELERLYNSCAVFLHTSWTEGFGLPGAEAMACGCALVAAANGGVKDYARDGESALMAPIKDPAALADRLLRLLGDDPLRRSLAAAGHRAIQTLTWERAVDRMEAVLADRTAAVPPPTSSGRQSS